MKEKLWKFIGDDGTFISGTADKNKALYFPLGNERIMSSITPDLHGDIKTGQDAFLMQPASRIDLSNLKSSRNFWVYIDKGKAWSATGVTKQKQDDLFRLEAGLLWHKIVRENRFIGLKAEILSFAPCTDEPVEIMRVTLMNTSSRRIKFTPTAAIPIYGRSADTIRDHRHVTSLLQRVEKHRFGVIVKPTMLFDESGHSLNKDIYFVLGADKRSRPPEYIYPTQESFCGDRGDLEAPESVLENRLPDSKLSIQGKETMGGLRFSEISLGPGKSHSYIILMGVSSSRQSIMDILAKFKASSKVDTAFEKTKKFWSGISRQVEMDSGDKDFDNWLRWVNCQPVLRRIFGCSFLPDFDYGKGGRGWRDLWQDCLGLILSEPEKVAGLLVNNFSGVRIDGSNATIIGKRPGEFIADRNDIARVWMDHGIWPLLTLELYMNESGDYSILFKEVPYFRDQHILRSRELDPSHSSGKGDKLRSASGKVYQGTILEHILVQALVQFHNVGRHNMVKLEGADWNDGLDMAQEKGESVAFSCMYAHNLGLLALILRELGKQKVKIAAELKELLKPLDYNNIRLKQKALERYFARTRYFLSGKKICIDSLKLARALEVKANWMAQHIQKKEWLKEGFFNGYYDNKSRRVEGRKAGVLRMTLTGQVFPIMSAIAQDWQVRKILESARKYLFDKTMKGYRLNTDFRSEQYDLGRAFSFAYGDKENGAFFNHMAVMFAYALYRRGFAKEGWQALSSVYDMSGDTSRSKIYPCLPEYFNSEGRGMYSYLTGSASWFMLALLTQAYGVRGKDGDLMIEPKLCLEQFGKSPAISIKRMFAGRRLWVSFSNPKRLDFGEYRITASRLNGRSLAVRPNVFLVIPRSLLLKEPGNKPCRIEISLG